MNDQIALLVTANDENMLSHFLESILRIKSNKNHQKLNPIYPPTSPFCPFTLILNVAPLEKVVAII